LEYRIQNTEYRIQNTEYRIRNTEYRIRNGDRSVPLYSQYDSGNGNVEQYMDAVSDNMSG